REKPERGSLMDGVAGYRNGFGKPRRLALSSGTIVVRRQRVRGLNERFESRILPLFVRRTKQLGELLPSLYLHGLAEGDFDQALRGLLGEGAPLSASSIARLKESWQVEFDVWKARSLEGIEVVYLWVDGISLAQGVGRRLPAPDGEGLAAGCFRRGGSALVPPGQPGISGSPGTGPPHVGSDLRQDHDVRI